MISKRKILGIILGTGAIGGGVTAYLYLNKSDIQEPITERLDEAVRNTNWARKKYKGSNWSSKYEGLDFKLDFSQGPIQKTASA